MKAGCVSLMILLSISMCVWAGDLDSVREAGVLRHIGVPYANFVTGTGGGLDVELMQRFAQHLGVRYEYVEANWGNVIQSLIGSEFDRSEPNVALVGDYPMRGDVIANGLTFLSWRDQLVDYSTPTFPTQVWLVAAADSELTPIEPSGDVNADIAAVRAQLADRRVLCKSNTCLDPSLHDLAGAGAEPVDFEGGLNDMVPAVLLGEAEATIIDVPDALVALERWGGRMKIIGPISQPQVMGVGFRPDCPQLRQEFNEFLDEIWADGTYLELVQEYYPAVFHYYPEFFALDEDMSETSVECANECENGVQAQ
ncbi:MAG: transporter substrate-binding domain-containing protein [Sedimentisphaerales bacterium]|nr:transporter substrate-binding domain-containing protein [Sedimentisphaerales bacterium]